MSSDPHKGAAVPADAILTMTCDECGMRESGRCDALEAKGWALWRTPKERWVCPACFDADAHPLNRKRSAG